MSETPREPKDVLDVVWALSLARQVAEAVQTAAPEPDVVDDLVEGLAARLPGRAVALMTATPDQPALGAAAASGSWAGRPPRLLSLTPAEGAAAGLDPEAYVQASSPKPYCAGSVTSARAPLSGPGISGLLCLERAQVLGAEETAADELVCQYLVGVLSAALAQYRARQEERARAQKVVRGVEQADPLVFLVDEDGKLVFSNRAVEQITGFRARDLARRSVRDWVGEGQPDGLIAAVDKARSGHVVRGQEVRLPLSTGGRVLAIFSVSPVVGADLQVEGVVGVGLSRRQLAALSMQVETQAVRRAELLGEVTRRVSEAAGELGGDGCSADTDTVARVASSLERLAAGLSAVVHTSSNPTRSLSMNLMVEGALEVVAEEISLHGARVRTALAGDLPEVQGDSERLRLAVAHLIRNACQALGDEGGRLSVRTWDNRDGTVGLSVSDDGVGVQQEWLGRIFQPFFSRPESAGRLGLGLTVVQDVVKEHDGSIVVDSEEGEGTVVTVTLPVRSVHRPEDKPA